MSGRVWRYKRGNHNT